ncbi:MAG: hypothetical protein J6J23_02465 [Clostridia bacterium]|nr:hypothetical protein [Clostridia bacterium]
MNESKMITLSTVISMGWTKAMVTALLPEPKLVANPHYRKAAPMKLYREQDVLEVMEGEEYKQALEKASKRKMSAQKATETKTERLKERMSEVGKTIEVKIMPVDEIISTVLKEKEERLYRQLEKQEEYYSRHFAEGKEFSDAWEETINELECFEFHMPGEETLKRWVVNYIRHNLVKYSEALYQVKGKIGKFDGYKALKIQILYKIASVYPQFAEECQRQAKEVESMSYDYRYSY